MKLCLFKLLLLFIVVVNSNDTLNRTTQQTRFQAQKVPEFTNKEGTQSNPPLANGSAPNRSFQTERRLPAASSSPNMKSSIEKDQRNPPTSSTVSAQVTKTTFQRFSPRERRSGVQGQQPSESKQNSKSIVGNMQKDNESASHLKKSDGLNPLSVEDTTIQQPQQQSRQGQTSWISISNLLWFTGGAASSFAVLGVAWICRYFRNTRYAEVSETKQTTNHQVTILRFR